MNDVVTTTVEKITVELAERWLALNRQNRPFNDRHVDLLAGAMSRGEWAVNGESIKFARDGLLVDGQHRLRAVIKAGIPVESLVVRGLDADAQDTMDRGRMRSVADALSLRGEKNAHAIAAAISWLIRMETGTVRDNGRVSPRQAIAYLEAHPGLRTVGPIVEPPRHTVRIPPGMAWACAYRFSELDYDDAVAFFRHLADGSNLAADSPLFRLRELLIAEMRTSRKTTPYSVCAVIIKAWNIWRDGGTVKQLRFRAGGSAPEPFPEPH